MSSDFDDLQADDSLLTTDVVMSKSALLPEGDAIYGPDGSPARPVEIYLRQPSPAEVVGQKMVWLGFRLGPSEWKGYLRIGFATDGDFNIATLDIHHSQFERLTKGMDMASGGRPAGIQFEVPSELASRQVRRSVGAMLLSVKEGVSDIQLLDLGRKTLMSARLYTPDLLLATKCIPSLLDQVEPGPDRRSLRRGDLEEVVLPPSWTEVMDTEPVEDLVTTTRRQDGTHDEIAFETKEVSVKLHNQRLCALDRMAVDFTDWPPALMLEYRTDSGDLKIGFYNFLRGDLQAMQNSLDDDLWVLRTTKTAQVDIPLANRRAMLDSIGEAFDQAEKAQGPAAKRWRSLQQSFEFLNLDDAISAKKQKAGHPESRNKSSAPASSAPGLFPESLQVG